MKNKGFRNLTKNFSVNKYARIFGLVPFVVVLIALIVVLALGVPSGNFSDAVGIGIDFEGGTILTVALGQDAIDHYDENRQRIVRTIEQYDVVVSYTQLQRAENVKDSSITFRYKNVSKNDNEINEKNDQIRDAVDKLFNRTEIRVVLGEQTATLFADAKAAIEAILQKEENGITNATIESHIDGTDASKSYISVVYENIDKTDAQLRVINQSVVTEIRAAYPDVEVTSDYNSPKITYESIGATAASDLLKKAGIALAVSVAIILVYIIIRFTLMSGFAAIIALLHDVVIMFCLTVICRVQINSSYVAAMITIIAYSINNTIIVFDRCREMIKPLKGQKNIDYRGIGDEAVRATFTRSLYTTLTTMVTVIFLAILGSDSIREFCIPIILGLIAGLFSSVCLAAPLWGAMSASFDKTKEKYKNRHSVSYDAPEEDKTVVKKEETEAVEEIKPAEVKKVQNKQKANTIYKYSKKNTTFKKKK